MEPFRVGQLVAVTGVVNRDAILRIARVVEVRGTKALVKTDDQIEGDAAIEHDFPTPEPAEMEVDIERLRPIMEEGS